ncbi:hypothetical protein NQZ79_g4774 [Umbelopsis isabellina]|nr:hypothetical protein NQZ79_g4774 [Umbelopsis isabellina]
MAEIKAGTPCTLLEKLVLHSPRPSSPHLRPGYRAKDLTALFQAAAATEEAEYQCKTTHNGSELNWSVYQDDNEDEDIVIDSFYEDGNAILYLHGAPLSKTFDIWEDNIDANDAEYFSCADWSPHALAEKDKENQPPSHFSVVQPVVTKKNHVCSTSRSHLMELQLRNFVNDVEALWRHSLHTKIKTTNFGKKGGRRNRVIQMTAKPNVRSRIPKSRYRVNILLPLDGRYLYSRYK